MLEFRLLGSLKLQGPEGEQILSVLSQPKRVALLSYLAVARPRGFHRRDKLVNLFWPDLDQDRARAALRKSLHHLRRSLGEEAVLSRGDEEVGLGSDSIRCDVVDFEEAAKGRPEEAMDLYRGHLLEGFHLAGCQEFQRWLDDERERLKELAAGAAWELAYRFASAGLLADGERMGQRALALAPTDETQVRRFVEALAKAGGRAAAVAFYERFARMLEEELELRPDAESRDLAERIRDSRVLQTPVEGDVSGVEEKDGFLAPAMPEPASRARTRAAGSDTALDSFRAAIADRYRIEREIGKGGMATVYLAQDLKHERKVAVKVLKPELAAVMGTERFLAEIRTTATLAHPHILPLHDSGEAGGFLFYVMPFVEGESLRQKLKRDGQLPLEEALRIAGHVADALDYAHRKGVIHRDVKPSNILFEDGQPVVTDFGIALAVSEAGEGRLTETGLSLGTPYYMSPEQAAGDQTPTAASDVYSLGCVLYEMLTGDPPHTGASTQAILGKILLAEVTRPTMLRRTIPANVEGAVLKALERLPADRFDSAGDLAAALKDKGFRHGVEAAGSAGPWKAIAIGFGGVAILAVGLAVWGGFQPDGHLPVSRYNLAFLPGQELQDGTRETFDIARGGALIAYVGPGGDPNRLWIKRRDRVEATPVSGTDGNPVCPSISPDGTEIVFWSEGQLRKVPVEGGAAVTVADSAAPSPAAWTDDGSLIYESLPDWHLMKVPSAGGPSEEIWSGSGELRYVAYAGALPGSDGVVFTRCDAQCGDPEIWVLDLNTGESRLLIPGGLRAWYLESGHLVYVRRDGGVFAVPFRAGGMEVTGSEIPILEGVKIEPLGYADISITSDGMLLMMMEGRSMEKPRHEVVRVSHEGMIQPVDTTWRFNIGSNMGWALSPDGTRLAIGLTTDGGDDIWIKELDDGPLARLTDDPGGDYRPRWSTDGEWLYFVSQRRGAHAGLWARRADGTGEAIPVVTRESPLWQHDMTLDGTWLVARLGGTDGNRDIVAYRMDTDTAEVPLLTSEHDEISPALSPDGRWLAYASFETGQWEVFVRPFPDVDSGKSSVSSGGGFSPVWAYSGGQLFYLSLNRDMMAASVQTSDGLRVTGREHLFSLPSDIFLGNRMGVYFDISSDDQDFIMVRDLGSDRAPALAPLILVENWLEEVEARAGGQGE